MSAYTIGSVPTIDGDVLNLPVKRAFDISFTTTYDLLDSSFQLTADVSSFISNGHFVSSSGYQTTGSKGILTVDNLSANVPAVRAVTSNIYANTSISGVATGPDGTIYFVDANNNLVYTTDLSGNYSIYAGTGALGTTNGPRLSATFKTPIGIAVDNSGSVYISELFNIRKIDSNGTVSTLVSGGFAYPRAIALDKDSNLYVTDTDNHVIKKVTPTGTVTPYAGGSGIPGFKDGPLLDSSFNFPQQLVFDASKSNLYIADYGNHVVRKIDTLTNTVSTYAGTPGSNGYVIGTYSTGWFTFPNGIAIDNSENMFVTQYFDNTIRVLSNNIIGAYAGRSGVSGNVNGLATSSTFNGPAYLASYGSNLFVAEIFNKQLRSVVKSVPSVKTSTVPGFDIIATRDIFVNAVNPINTEVTGNTIQLYAYEPFSNYTWNTLVSTDTLRYTNSSPELLSFLSNTSPTSIEFASTTGFGRGYSTPLTLLIEDLCGSTVMESKSYTVTVGNGRFFPPSAGTAYVFYKNEPITPQLFVAPIPIQNPLVVPTLPVGLSFTRVDSNSFNLTGAPLFQLPASNYKVIGKGSVDPTKVVTVDINIRVNRERVLLDVCGNTNYLGLAPSVPIVPTVVTARAYQYGSGNIKYTWSPGLLDGLSFKDIYGNVLSSGAVPTDPSSTIILSGTPTDIAARSIDTSYSLTLTANRTTSGADASSTPFTFSFNELIVFSNPVLQSNYYVGATLDSNSNYFFAETKFATNAPTIVGMSSFDLPDGLDISFVSTNKRGYLVGSPFDTGSGTFTVFASNTNDTVGSITVPYSISNDQIIISPTSDLCYNFIQTRSLSNAKTGYYPSPIQFKASTLSGCNVVMSTTDLDGTGITLSNVSNSTYQLTGIPIVSAPQSVLTITLESPDTEITKDISLNYAILPDTFTFSPKQFDFIQNQTITPYQFSVSTLSGRNIVNYSSSNLPNNLFLSAGGYLTGIMREGTSGTFDIVATTGYASDVSSYGYITTPDSVLLLTEPTTYNYNVGDNVSIQVQGFSYSGSPVSNYTFSNFSPSYGLSINSTTGAITGTLTGPLPASCNFYVKGSVGTVTGELGATLTSDGTIQFDTLTLGGPTFVSPAQTGYLLYQYMPITPIFLDAVGSGTSYYYINSNDLPIGLKFDPVNQLIYGTPMRIGQDSITVYAKDDVGVTQLSLSTNTIIPRIVKNQIGAGAYTSLIRQYTEVNAAQNARDNRVYPTQDRAAGEFQAPTAPDVITQSNCDTCKN